MESAHRATSAGTSMPHSAPVRRRHMQVAGQSPIRRQVECKRTAARSGQGRLRSLKPKPPASVLAVSSVETARTISSALTTANGSGPFRQTASTGSVTRSRRDLQAGPSRGRGVEWPALRQVGRTDRNLERVSASAVADLRNHQCWQGWFRARAWRLSVPSAAIAYLLAGDGQGLSRRWQASADSESRAVRGLDQLRVEHSR